MLKVEQLESRMCPYTVTLTPERVLVLDASNGGRHAIKIMDSVDTGTEIRVNGKLAASGQYERIELVLDSKDKSKWLIEGFDSSHMRKGTLGGVRSYRAWSDPVWGIVEFEAVVDRPLESNARWSVRYVGRTPEPGDEDLMYQWYVGDPNGLP